MKKNAISARTPAARAVSVQRRRRSGSRAAAGDRSRFERSPWVNVPAAMPRSGRLDRGAVALQAVDLGLGLLLDGRRERRVLQLLGRVLPCGQRVVEPRLHAGRLVRRQTGLAHVLVGEQEGARGDRVRLVARRVDRAEAQVAGNADAVAGGRGGLERRGDVVPGLVLDVGGREVVRERVRLLDVAHAAVVLLHAGRDAVVALGARAGRPLDRLVDAGAALPLGRVVGEEGREELRRAGLVRAVADRDRLVGQLRARVGCGDGRVVPLLDLAEEDVRDGLAVELEPLVDAVDVVGDRDGPEDARDVDGLALLLGRRDLRVLHGGVRGAEVDGAGGELGDAATGADALVVDAEAVLVLQARGPLLVDGQGEGGAGAVDRAGQRLRAARGAVAAARGAAAPTARGDAEAERGDGQHGDEEVMVSHDGEARSGRPAACYEAVAAL